MPRRKKETNDDDGASSSKKPTPDPDVEQSAVSRRPQRMAKSVAIANMTHTPAALSHQPSSSNPSPKKTPTKRTSGTARRVSSSIKTTPALKIDSLESSEETESLSKSTKHDFSTKKIEVIDLTVDSGPSGPDMHRSNIAIRLKRELLLLPNSIVVNKSKLVHAVICPKKFEKLPTGLQQICQLDRMDFLDGITLEGVLYPKPVIIMASRPIYLDLHKDIDEHEKSHFQWLVSMIHVRGIDFQVLENPTLYDDAITVIQYYAGEGTDAEARLQREKAQVLKLLSTGKLLDKSETIKKAQLLQLKLNEVESSEQAEEVFAKFSKNILPCVAAGYKGYYLMDKNQIDGRTVEPFIPKAGWI
ncbi:ERCC4 domain-containing protein [Caenorhabditis elegans]|uniref:ERCC4 domain-containing protein n=1 Tax=Caenorhabditis elegans TaxID=6239 RepID=O62124_CAEEL|nr:ERCC4 domain-containing protein [Caenorhabditis elegans]CAB05474.1 ERCC4 domain-containing protein [Caenorhabditis elegans]|eukprot:NP_510415.1 Uncharacterized protein CELE_D1025.1 [Caenorhabditis elegans]